MIDVVEARCDIGFKDPLRVLLAAQAIEALSERVRTASTLSKPV
jgi:hypothetical protein